MSEHGKRSGWSFAFREIVFMGLCGFGGFALAPLFKPREGSMDVAIWMGSLIGVLTGLGLHLLLPRK